MYNFIAIFNIILIKLQYPDQQMRDILTVVFIIFTALPSSSQAGWQGYGNLSSENLTSIWGYINSNIQGAVTNSNIDDFNTGLSTHLNDLWSPAWNIVTIEQLTPSDSILYGYAFRRHWMWYNDYQVSTKSINFIIWKDYNCQGWKSIGQSSSLSSFQLTNTQSVSDSIKTAFPDNAQITDIWAQSKSFMDLLVTKSGFSGVDKAFSIVMSSNPDAFIYGRVCLASNNWVKGTTLNSDTSKNGKYLLFQTRSYSVYSNLLLNSQIQSYRNAELLKHNQVRALHGSPALVINETLNGIAQSYSDYLANEVHNLEHSSSAKSGSYGENLYWGWANPTLTYSQAAASTSWYGEVSKYTFGSFPPASGTGHFTAMVWKSVTSVGFGYYKVAEDGGYAIYVVANYYPTPNIYTKAYYDANVLPKN